MTARGPASRPPRLPLVLLGLLTVATTAGPFLILAAVRGGASPGWPPDRPVEWWAFGSVTAVVVGLLAGCVTTGLWAGEKS